VALVDFVAPEVILANDNWLLLGCWASADEGLFGGLSDTHNTYRNKLFEFADLRMARGIFCTSLT